MPDDPPAAATHPAGGAPRIALDRDLAAFLLEFAIALNSQGIYPPGHPMLVQAAETLCARLQGLLLERPRVSVGIAHRQLVVEGVATEMDNPVLAGLALRLHRRRIGVLSLERGIGPDDLTALLRALSNESGALPEGDAAPWRHARIHAISYGQLQLREDADDQGAGGPAPLAERLWLDLACAALERPPEEVDPGVDPAVVAEAIDRPQAATYDQVIVGHLLQLGRELGGEGSETAPVRRRISSLVTSLSPETLERLVAMGGEASQRRRFVLDAAQGFAAEAVVEIVRAASAAEQPISSSMLRLLGKLAAHAGTAEPDRRASAGTALREQVIALVGNWSLSTPNPEAYGELLDTMARTRIGIAVPADGSAGEPEPLRLVQMFLEIGVAGPGLPAAAAAVADGGREEVLLGLMDADAPPSPAADAVWEVLSAEDRVRALLARGAGAAPVLERVLERGGAGLAPLLLEVLATSPSSTERRAALRGLARIGDPILPAVQRGLAAQAPWYVHRNLLVLVHDLGARLPPASRPRLVGHEDPRVRREALRVLMADPDERTRALGRALTDADPQVRHPGLVEAQRGCPPEVVPLVLARIGDPGEPMEHRVLAVRALRRERDPRVRDRLVALVLPRRGWFGRARPGPWTPEVAAAVEVLAATWGEDPAAASALRRSKPGASGHTPSGGGA